MIQNNYLKTANFTIQLLETSSPPGHFHNSHYESIISNTAAYDSIITDIEIFLKEGGKVRRQKT